MEAKYKVDPLDPRAPSQEIWDQMSESERRALLDALPSRSQLSASKLNNARARAEAATLRADREHQRAEQESQHAEQESQRAERLAARLRELGVDPS